MATGQGGSECGEGFDEGSELKDLGDFAFAFFWWVVREDDCGGTGGDYLAYEFVAV